MSLESRYQDESRSSQSKRIGCLARSVPRNNGHQVRVQAGWKSSCSYGYALGKALVQARLDQ
jgi:hypothetical protein